MSNQHDYLADGTYAPMNVDLDARLDRMEKQIDTIRQDQVKLLEGIAKFFAMAEQMKGNPLFAALMPQQAPPQRGKR